MELKAKLEYTNESEKMDFIAEYNHRQGYEIRYSIEERVLEEDDDTNSIMVNIIEAWGYTEEEKKEQAAQLVRQLKCTKRNFALMLQEMGISYYQIKELIATNEQAQLEWDLCVELERSNPLLDTMAQQLGVSSEQLDTIFKRANGID